MGGVQVNTPVAELMTAPAGALGSRLNARVLGGISESLAEIVTDISTPGNAVWSLTTDSTGALLASLTVTAKLLVALIGGTPSSVTTVVIVYRPGPCASLGVQRITPLVSMPAPAG